jgi:hypothetical protein
MGGIPIAPHTEVVAAALIVQIIVETAQLTVLKTYAGETRAAGHRGCHHLHDHSESPLLIAQVRNFIPDTEEESLALAKRVRHVGSMAMILRDEIGRRDRRLYAPLPS